MMTLWLVLAAFIAGVINAIAGSGGLIVLPLLLAAGVPPINALATNKCQSVFGTLSSAVNFFRHGFIDLHSLRMIVLFAMIGACVGTWLVQQLNTAHLKQLLPYFLLLLGAYVAMTPTLSDEDVAPSLPRSTFDPIVGTGMGLYGGFFGPGMGSLSAVAFSSLRGFNIKKATAHAKPLVLTINVTSMAVFLWAGLVWWKLALAMGVAQIFGARLGSNIAMKQGVVLIKPLLVSVIVALALKLLVWP